MSDTDKRDRMIAKVKLLWERAEHPNTPEAEAASCRDMAARIMAEYEIEQFVLAAESGGEPEIVLGLFRIDSFNDKGKSTMILSDERMLLAGAISRNFECKGVIKSQRSPSADPDTGKPIAAGTFYECIGYKHDFDMVKTLYFSLVVDLLEGVYLEPQHNKNYQQEYARGFVSKIDDRLKEFYRRVQDFDDSTVSDSVALAIRSRLQKVQDKFNEMYGDSLLPVKTKSTSYDPNARKRGRARAEASDIGGAKLGGSKASGEIGTAKKELSS